MVIEKVNEKRQNLTYFAKTKIFTFCETHNIIYSRWIIAMKLIKREYLQDLIDIDINSNLVKFDNLRDYMALNNYIEENYIFRFQTI